MSYNLKQLLEWSFEDHLIQGYSFRPDSLVEIRHSGKADVYEKKEAEILLRRLIRRMNEGAMMTRRDGNHLTQHEELAELYT